MNLPIDPDNLDALLTAFADGELDAPQHLAVLDYLEAHPEGFARLRERQHLRNAVRRIADENARADPMPAALRARLGQIAAEAAAPEATRTARVSTLGWIGGGLAVAASLALGMMVGGFWKSNPPPIAAVPTPGGLTAQQVDFRDAAIPVSTVRAVTKVHIDCSRVDERLHAGGYAKDLGDLAATVTADLNVKAPEPDLSSIGYHFVGAGPCADPLAGTAHLLYKKDGPEPRATISLFVQPYHGQFALQTARMYCIADATATFPMCAWRSERVVYFLVADDLGAAVAARTAIPAAPRAGV